MYPTQLTNGPPIGGDKDKGKVCNICLLNVQVETRTALRDWLCYHHQDPTSKHSGHNFLDPALLPK